MKKYYPSVPDDCQIVGFIYSHDDLTLLGEDMVDVVAPGGILISAGWFPEGDQNGRYRVTVSRDFEEFFRLETQSALETVAFVEALATRFSAPRPFFVSESGSLNDDDPVVSATQAGNRFSASYDPYRVLVIGRGYRTFELA